MPACDSRGRARCCPMFHWRRMRALSVGVGQPQLRHAGLPDGFKTNTLGMYHCDVAAGCLLAALAAASAQPRSARTGAAAAAWQAGAGAAARLTLLTAAAMRALTLADRPTCPAVPSLRAVVVAGADVLLHGALAPRVPIQAHLLQQATSIAVAAACALIMTGALPDACARSSCDARWGASARQCSDTAAINEPALVLAVLAAAAAAGALVACAERAARRQYLRAVRSVAARRFEALAGDAGHALGRPGPSKGFGM